MPSIVIGQGKVAIITVVGEDPTGKPALTTGTVTIDKYDTAYIVSTGKPSEYMIVPKITIPPGESVDVTATFSAKASDGSVIADFVVAFTLQGQPLAVATQLVLQSSQVVDAASVTVPADPGSGTISITG